jgi:6-phosphofructokinase 1
MVALFEEEGGQLFGVRQAILGHLQQGGDPTPFDRIQATRLASRCIDWLIDQANTSQAEGAFIGLGNGQIRFHNLDDFLRMSDHKFERPKEQWWLELRPIARVMAQPGPKSMADGNI